MCVGEAREVANWAFAVYFDFFGFFVFGAGFAEDGVGGQGFVVKLSNQIGFAGVVFLPDLADLDFAGGHSTNVDRIVRGVNMGARGWFPGANGGAGSVGAERHYRSGAESAENTGRGDLAAELREYREKQIPRFGRDDSCFVYDPRPRLPGGKPAGCLRGSRQDLLWAGQRFRPGRLLVAGGAGGPLSVGGANYSWGFAIQTIQQGAAWGVYNPRRIRGRWLMKTNLAAQLGAMIVAASLITSTSGAAFPQQGQQQPTPQSTSSPSTPTQQTQQGSGQQPDQKQPAQQPAQQPSQQQGSVQQADQQAQGPAPVQQQEDPKVKAGSEADVSSIGNRNVGHGLNFYSLEHEIALGKQLSAEVERQAKFINDPVVVEYVNRVGQNLVRNSDAQVPFTIKVIDSDVVNAFALPGGFFYVNSGLILHADEESELAGVMAHEIAHVCARHGTKQATKGEITQLAMIPAMIFIPYTWAGYAIYQGMQFAIPMAFLQFTRTDEKEADYLGLQYMYKAGYDPNAFVSFFEKVAADEKKQPGTIPKIFSTHPPTPDRIEASQKEIATILPQRDEYIVTTSEFDQVKHRLQLIEANVKVNDKNPNKPTLRKKTATNKPGDSTTTQGGSTTDPDSDPDRPTLQRRPDPNQQP